MRAVPLLALAGEEMGLGVRELNPFSLPMSRLGFSGLDSSHLWRIDGGSLVQTAYLNWLISPQRDSLPLATAAKVYVETRSRRLIPSAIDISYRLPMYLDVTTRNVTRPWCWTPAPCWGSMGGFIRPRVPIAAYIKIRAPAKSICLYNVERPCDPLRELCRTIQLPLYKPTAL